MFKFPYTNFNEVNLNWILRRLKEIPDLSTFINQVRDLVRQAEDHADDSAQSAEDAAQSAEDAAQSAEDAAASAQDAETSAEDAAGALEQLLTGGPDMAFFGDSWTVGAGIAVGPDRENLRFSTLLANRFGKNQLNYAVGASGFLIPNNQITTQIDTALEKPREDRLNVGMAVLVAGVNDWRHRNDYNITKTAWCNQIENDVRKLHLCYPNAKLIIGLCNSEQYVMTDEWSSWMTAAQAQLAKNLSFPVVLVQHVAECINFRSDTYASDGLHPNILGHAILAGHITKAIMGGGMDIFFCTGAVVPNSGYVPNIGVSVYRDNEKAILTEDQWIFNTELPVNTNVTIGVLPNKNVVPMKTFYVPMYRGGAVVGTCAVTPSGNVTCRNTSSAALGNAFIGSITYIIRKEGTT